MGFLVGVFLIIAGVFYSRRYLPVAGVQELSCEDKKVSSKALLLDVRDYNVATRSPVSNALNLPHAYLRRHYQTIPYQELIVIASEPVTKNMSVRFLQKQGFTVKGYYLTNETI